MPESLVLPASPSPRVSVIIPAAAKPGLLLACLHSLARHGPREIPFETIVVLNAASGEAEARLDETVTGLRWVSSPVNLGLAGAGNRGRSLARGEYLVLLHDDAEVEPGWLEALVETADRHPEAGAVASQVLFPDGRLQSAGMILWRDATTSTPWLGAPPSPSAFDRPRPVDYSGSCSLLVRAATWDAVGGLEERFYPAYFVDVDLAMAVRRHGQLVLYEPRSRIRHHQGASGSPRFRVFVTQRNRRLFLEKWGSALEEHEPREEGSPEAIQRALTRAESRYVVAPVPRDRPRRMDLDPDLQERRHLEMDLALQRDYVAHLAAILKETETVTAAERAELRQRLATVEGSRWWRLYQRLLPFLRVLRRLGPR